jgi:hypothetical protein
MQSDGSITAKKLHEVSMNDNTEYISTECMQETFDENAKNDEEKNITTISDIESENPTDDRAI